jgi:DNA polymerase-3 subunit gamma/tau
VYYQKYRPQLISQLDSVKIRETLGQALLNDKFVHAYLLTGPKGIGKTTTARLVAKIVNCTNRKTGQEPCRKCESCLAVESGSSLDVVEIDAASNRSIDEIRTLREGIKLAPFSLKYKVYIIDEVHMLTTEAFNALLKTLEEPPSHVIFVLATTDVHKVPETVKSRCQNFNFALSTIEETCSSLRRVRSGEGLEGIDDEILKIIAEKSQGSFRDATKMLEQLVGTMNRLTDKVTVDDLSRIIFVVGRGEVGKFLGMALQDDKKEAFDWLEKFVANQGQVKDLMVSMISYLRDVLLKVSETQDLKLTDEEIVALIKELLEALTLIAISPVPQLPLEMVIAEWSKNKRSPNIIPDKRQRDPESAYKDGKIPGQVRDDVEKAGNMWIQILEKVKPSSPSVFALLKAARIGQQDGGILTIEVLYKFHKDRLEEEKNRVVLEKVVSDIMKKETQVRFVLVSK